jgi:hypothetical protein
MRFLDPFLTCMDRSWSVCMYKNLSLFLIFSVQPLILYLRLKFRRG